MTGSMVASARCGSAHGGPNLAKRPTIVTALTGLLAAGAGGVRGQPAAAPEPPGLVAPFVLPATGAARDRAVACLTAAIYYEAASEPLAGQEAVAQVVLNRVRHPAYPKSVCGVVYQGVGGPLACQFTFACDGSQSRRPVARFWQAANEVAVAALDGRVAQQVGASTHYHAVWVSPAWRASLVETGRIGGHVFYRMPGWAGSAAALTGRYDGEETETGPAVPAPALEGLGTPSRPHGRTPRAHPSANVVQFAPWGLEVATIRVKGNHFLVERPS